MTSPFSKYFFTSTKTLRAKKQELEALKSRLTDANADIFVQELVSRQSTTGNSRAAAIAEINIRADELIGTVMPTTNLIAELEREIWSRSSMKKLKLRRKELVEMLDLAAKPEKMDALDPEGAIVRTIPIQSELSRIDREIALGFGRNPNRRLWTALFAGSVFILLVYGGIKAIM